MKMAKSFNTLRKKMTPRQRALSDDKAQKMLVEMPLNELRLAQQYTQEQLADVLDTKQAGLSRLEKQTDMYISTLKRYIEAMGGELDIIARFPSGDVSVSQFNCDNQKTTNTSKSTGSPKGKR